jgi:hypothetical protein
MEAHTLVSLFQERELSHSIPYMANQDLELHQSEWLRSKIQVTAHVGKDVEKEEHSSITVELQTGTTTLEINLKFPQKIENRSIW